MIPVNIDQLWQNRPFIISGPCAAESREQVLSTAQKLQETGKVHLFRSGIWKPRTRPGMFEGVGKPGLTWLIEARKETGIPVMVEVATDKHVEDALEAGIDVLWIGARTTVNPFSVQEIADALKGVSVPVFIKNPVHPDPDLWTGAIERIQKAGISTTGMIHRGFSQYGNTDYRNAPMWQLPIEMKRRFPGMPLICDPSHICGNRFMLREVAQQSVDLGFDGLMLESHIDPDNALSDALQQVTPEGFLEIINSITWRSVGAMNEALMTPLLKLREQINHVDDELLSLLSRRMRLADKIGEYKKENNITIFQAQRWNEILERAFRKGESLGLSREFLLNYFDAVHLESILHQDRVMNEEKVSSEKPNEPQ